MKKRLVSGFLAAVMAAALVAGCGSSGTDTTGDAAQAAEEAEDETVNADDETAAAEAAEDTAGVEGIQADSELYASADLSALEGKKIGVTIQSLQNTYWAGVMTMLGDVLEENGAEYTIVACDDNSATQISQIENFISAECDLILVHPSDADAIEDTCAQAREQGIKVMCWDDPMTNTDANWVLDNTEYGYIVGSMAGEFISEYYTEDNPAEVCLIGYPQTTILKERGDGIKQGLEDTAAGLYELVSEQAALEASEAQTVMETVLQKNPDCTIVVGIGSGAMIGANEALEIYTGGVIPENMGVFTADVTKQQLEELLDDGAASKGCVVTEGSDTDTANDLAAMFALILSDSLEAQNVFRELSPLTYEDVDRINELLAGML